MKYLKIFFLFAFLLVSIVSLAATQRAVVIESMTATW